MGIEICWNPLELAGEHEEYKQIALNSTKQQIHNILKSYVGYYDPFCELIQNAMDATDKRAESLAETEYKKRITITIDLSQNAIYIADNGIGFDATTFKTFLCPNVSFKASGKSRGNKGVGATYLAYGFSRMELYTKTPDFEQYAAINGGYDWILDSTDKIEPPLVKVLQEADIQFPYNEVLHLSCI